MSKPFDRDHLLAALDAVGTAAASNGTRLKLAIYGGSALMLAGNFRFSTEDVDIAEIDVRPAWLDAVVAEIAAQNGWSANWLNEAVAFHLSPLADAAADHLEYGTYPRGGPIGSTRRTRRCRFSPATFRGRRRIARSSVSCSSISIRATRRDP